MSRIFGANNYEALPTRRHRPDKVLLLFICILLLLGLVIIYSISPALIARLGDNTTDQNIYLYRQLLFLAAGGVAFAITTLVPANFWAKYKGKLLVGGIILCALPFVFQATSLAICANGACRWLNLGFTSFQPAEALKLALIIYLAGFLAARISQDKLDDWHQTLIPVGIILLLICAIVIGLQKDLGTGITIVAIVMVMLFVAGINSRMLLISLGVCLAVGVAFTITSPHRMERILTFLQSESSESDEESYQITQALIAIGSGGLTGAGIGQGIQAYGYLPEAANDSIFAVLAEKFGFLGTIAVLLIFAGLFVRILGIMDRTANLYYRLIVAGVFGWIFSHAAVNIGAMLGVFPLTGITLPFVSFGGTSLVFMLGALGLVYQISRYTTYEKLSDNQKTGGAYENRERRRGVGRTRYSGIGRAV